jgi:hypothetical protein
MATKISTFIVLGFASLAWAGNQSLGSSSPKVCGPAEDCPVEGDVCCPHAPGPDVPFTCAPEPCFRTTGELCGAGDVCATKGDVCCPHAPGPDVPFTCAPEPCFR